MNTERLELVELMYNFPRYRFLCSLVLAPVLNYICLVASFFLLELHWKLKELCVISFFVNEMNLLCIMTSFNHKTAAEDVHFTSVSYYSESDIDSDNSDDEKNGDYEPMAQDFHSEMGDFRSELEIKSSSTSGNDVMVMQMIICKDVNSGAEVGTPADCYSLLVFYAFILSLKLNFP